MKDKILMFVIGFLVGAIVATGGFVVYEKVKAKNNPAKGQFQREDGMPMMHHGEKMEDMQEPPELPSGEMMQNMPQQNPDEQTTENSNKQKMQDRKNKQVENQTQNEANV